MPLELSTKRGFRGKRRKVQARPRDPREEHFVLRVKDANLAERLRTALGEDSRSDESETEDSSKEATQVEEERLDIKLVFEEGSKGNLMVNEESFPVRIARLPSAVESFKTLDDLHCVKLSDVNQIFIVGEEEEVEEEIKNGVTPPFHDVRDRFFKPEPKYSKEDVSRVEEALLSIFEGWAPAGWKFVDTEEECVNEDGAMVWKEI